MLQETVFDHSWRVLGLGEHDRRLVRANADPEQPVGRTTSTVVRRLRRVPFEAVVAKPLVESGRAALSECRRAGEGDLDATPLLQRCTFEHPAISAPRLRTTTSSRFATTPTTGVRGVRVSTRETVTSLLSERLTPISAAALFWWTRNQLYFDQQLWNDDRIKIVNYEAALNRPVEMVDALSSYLGVGLPSQAIAAEDPSI